MCAEAAATLIVANLAPSLFSVRSIVGYTSRACKARPFAPDRSDWIERAIDDVANRLWVRVPSLSKALAIHLMLRRRGQINHLRFGLVAMGGEWKLCTWVALADQRTLGYPTGIEPIPFTVSADPP